MVTGRTCSPSRSPRSKLRAIRRFVIFKHYVRSLSLQEHSDTANQANLSFHTVKQRQTGSASVQARPASQQHAEVDLDEYAPEERADGSPARGRAPALARSPDRRDGCTPSPPPTSPAFTDVADEVRDALADAVPVGHNVRIDLEVLSRILPDWTPVEAFDTDHLRLPTSMDRSTPRIHGCSTWHPLCYPSQEQSPWHTCSRTCGQQPTREPHAHVCP